MAGNKSTMNESSTAKATIQQAVAQWEEERKNREHNRQQRLLAKYQRLYDAQRKQLYANILQWLGKDVTTALQLQYCDSGIPELHDEETFGSYSLYAASEYFQIQLYYRHTGEGYEAYYIERIDVPDYLRRPIELETGAERDIIISVLAETMQEAVSK